MGDVVLVRACLGRPLQRVAIRSTKRLVYIVSPATVPTLGITEAVGVGFPHRDVYMFDSKAYAELSAAFTQAGSLSRNEWQDKGLLQYRTQY